MKVRLQGEAPKTVLSAVQGAYDVSTGPMTLLQVRDRSGSRFRAG